MATTSERFWSKVGFRESGCWEWTAALNDGYGQFSLNGKLQYAHRLSWAWVNGFVPDGLQLDHLCRNRACVNPTHLEIVDGRTNVLRGIGLAAQNARKTHCPHGHPYTADNIWWRRGRWRDCRTCRLAENKRSRARRARVAP